MLSFKSEEFVLGRKYINEETNQLIMVEWQVIYTYTGLQELITAQGRTILVGDNVLPADASIDQIKERIGEVEGNGSDFWTSLKEGHETTAIMFHIQETSKVVLPEF